MRFALTLAYDGRPYEGWQSQRGGNTVQDILLAALRSIDPAIGQVHGSGRTDAGVCAEGQVAHFDVGENSSLNAAAWVRALNTRLPATIRALDCHLVDDEFHARFSASGKSYRYRLWLGRILPPLEHGLAWRVRPDLDRNALRRALDRYLGEHDFRAFAANRGDGKDADRDCVRTIEAVSIDTDAAPDRPMLAVCFDGSGFLYKMVRLLIGTAVRHAEHPDKVPLEEIDRLLDAPAANEKAPFCAPSDGLSLISVRYPE